MASDMTEGKKAVKNVKLQAQLDELMDMGARPRDPIKVEVGMPLPRNKEYGSRQARMGFLEASYRGGARYKRSNDAEGQPILVRHEQESAKSWERRLRMSSCHNFVKPIVDKLISFVFTSPITRSTEGAFDEWAGDVDGNDMCLHEFMKRAVLMAEITGKWYIQMDSTKPEDRMTMAAVQAAGSKIILSDLHPKRVLDWRKDPCQLLVVDDSIGEYGGARLWSDDFVQVIELGKDGRVARILPADAHEWESMPIICVESHCSGESIVEDVAELQASIFNMDSILKEELSKQTFSQWWLASPNVRPEDLQSVDVGSRKVLVLPVDANTIKFERLAGDTSQADSIRSSIAADIQEVYRIMGLKDPTVEQGTESGRALKIRFTETAFIAASLSDMAEDAEEKITELWASAMGQEIEGPEYPDSFDDEDVGQELQSAIQVVGTAFPDSLKRAQVTKWADDAFSGSVEPENLSEMHREILETWPGGQPSSVEPGTEAPVVAEGTPGLTADPYSRSALVKGAAEEKQAHPQLSDEQALGIAKDHLKADPAYYEKKG